VTAAVLLLVVVFLSGMVVGTVTGGVILWHRWRR
jgi:hypothetical protein